MTRPLGDLMAAACRVKAQRDIAERAELLRERAAIIEFCGNLPRAEAERLAMEQMEGGEE